MEIIRDPRQMQSVANGLRRAGHVIGFVPTMGALHNGHLSLLDTARQHADTIVMSIFVNPIQFGPTEDFAKYPRPFERDCELARERGCAYMFAPERSAMYPPEHQTFVEVLGVTERLCGASRPGHFRGVATVVTKLCNAVLADVAVFGQKDAQQVLVIKRMVADLNMPVRIVVAPTARETDGLAMSSRNVYLTPGERAQAPAISRALNAIRAAYDAGGRDRIALEAAGRAVLATAPLLSIEYLDVVDTVRVQPLERVESTALVAIACRTAESRTRLIDNVVLGGEL